MGLFDPVCILFSYKLQHYKRSHALAMGIDLIEPASASAHILWKWYLYFGFEWGFSTKKNVKQKLSNERKEKGKTLVTSNSLRNLSLSLFVLMKNNMNFVRLAFESKPNRNRTKCHHICSVRCANIQDGFVKLLCVGLILALIWWTKLLSNRTKTWWAKVNKYVLKNIHGACCTMTMSVCACSIFESFAHLIAGTPFLRSCYA